MHHIEPLSTQSTAVGLLKQTTRRFLKFGAIVAINDRDQLSSALAIVRLYRSR
jgi:hypothetical protein